MDGWIDRWRDKYNNQQDINPMHGQLNKIYEKDINGRMDG